MRSHIFIGKTLVQKEKIFMSLLMLVIQYVLDLIDYVLHKNDNSNSHKEKPTKTSVLID